MQDGHMESMRKSGHISGSNAAYVEGLYEEFLADPLSISEQWRDFFKSLSAPEGGGYPDVSHSEVKKHFEALGKVSRHPRVLSNEEVVNSEHESKQVQCPLRKPLVIMSPKNLLRHKESAASLTDLADGSFQTVINETGGFDSAEITKVIICSGKIYNNLRSERRVRGIRDAAIIRLEQLYPFPQDDFQRALVQYRN